MLFRMRITSGIRRRVTPWDCSMVRGASARRTCVRRAFLNFEIWLSDKRSHRQGSVHPDIPGNSEAVFLKLASEFVNILYLMFYHQRVSMLRYNWPLSSSRLFNFPVISASDVCCSALQKGTLGLRILLTKLNVSGVLPRTVLRRSYKLAIEAKGATNSY